ncbi:MAG: hypothetical protein SFU56_08870 [Capsulimonadales bacterium]|nr:hypothetical protein [Capsulimonadales bacterium]
MNKKNLVLLVMWMLILTGLVLGEVAVRSDRPRSNPEPTCVSMPPGITPPPGVKVDRC